MTSDSPQAETLAQIEIRVTNALLSAQSLWDGFWIHSFKQGLLCIAGSFDRSYRRDVELRFHGTLFFNLPREWRDTDCLEGAWFRQSSFEELHDHCGVINDLNQDQLSDLPWVGLSVYAFDFSYRQPRAEGTQSSRPFTAFVVALYFEAFKVIVGDGGAEYEDPCLQDQFPSARNRVPLFDR